MKRTQLKSGKFKPGKFKLASCIWVVGLTAIAGQALALEYASVTESSAVLYDAPSTKAKKIFVVSRYWPLEQVVTLDAWIKVRDSSGSLAWIEKRDVSNKRFVVVTVPLATLRPLPEDGGVVIMQARQQVALEWLENTGTGWLKVRHADGLTGYVKTTEVWGD